MKAPSPSPSKYFSSPTARQDFLERARQTLRGNDMGEFVKPGRYQYPHQWNWDAALIALGLSHFDPPRARKEIRSLLRGQWGDGMLPHIIYHNGASDYFPDPQFWRTEDSPHAPTAVATSGLTQPPILASCLHLMHQRAGDRRESLKFVHEVYPALTRWHHWLHRARDPQETGLVAIIHPWESGTDNAARWIEPLLQVTPSRLPPYTRRDSQHVDKQERPRRADYERFIYLIDRFRSWSYDAAISYQKSPFLVQDTLFNAVLYRAHCDLIALGQELGEPADALERLAAHLKRTFNDRLWDHSAGCYYAYDLRNRRLIRENGCATFIPLFAGIADPRQAETLVKRHLENPEEYAPDGSSRYYLPSQAKNHYFYEPRRYWRGPVWILINWLVESGLRRYGYRQQADTLRRHSLELMINSGFSEYYDPRDGSPAGASDFSWSAALALELLEAPRIEPLEEA